MERFLKRRLPEESSTPNPQPQALDEGERIKLGPSLEKRFLKLDLEQLQNDPGLRPRISNYHPSDREVIKRYYLQKGPCQPKEINFPFRKFGEASRRFNPDWYSKYGGFKFIYTWCPHFPKFLDLSLPQFKAVKALGLEQVCKEI
jgi:hypothetical protein